MSTQVAGCRCCWAVMEKNTVPGGMGSAGEHTGCRLVPSLGCNENNSVGSGGKGGAGEHTSWLFRIEVKQPAKKQSIWLCQGQAMRFTRRMAMRCATNDTVSGCPNTLCCTPLQYFTKKLEDSPSLLSASISFMLQAMFLCRGSYFSDACIWFWSVV